jgi:CheY-like chemotaxis protein
MVDGMAVGMMIAAEAAGIAGGRDDRHVPCDRARILIVDDETSIVKLFKMLLEFDLPGRQIDTACNGAEAVEKFASGHHRVLIMDLHMPVMDGLHAFLNIETACRERSWEMPAVVFCTGYAPPDTVLKAVGEGGTHCLLQKPVTSETLVKTVASRLAS